jgi:MFS family permease
MGMSDARGWGRGATGVARGARAGIGHVASGTRRGTRGAGRLVRRVTGASGAARTGLATLTELTAAGSFGDAFVAVSLAGTIFFSTSVDQARGRVILFLLVTMAPFAVLAPFIGPALDRMQQGRRYLLAGTLLARGLLCWGMSAAISDPLTLLPAAFGVLVLQKCYGVVRASVAPRLLPSEITLVTANARSALVALIASTIAAPAAAGIDWAFGPAWVLRAGTIVYLAAIVIALRLPDHVDVPTAAAGATAPTAADSGPSAAPAGFSAAPAYPDPSSPATPQPGDARRRPEWADDVPGWTLPMDEGGAARPDPVRPAAGPGGAEPGGREPGGPEAGGEQGARENPGAPGSRPRRRRIGPLRTLSSVGPVVAEAMRGNAVLRAFSGYMIFFLAFLLRTEHFPVSGNLLLGAMVAAAGAGGLVAMAIGSVIGSRAPQVLLFTMLVVATVVAGACAWFFSFESALIVAFVAAMSTGLAKLALDSIVQREISEDVRSSAFAVSETLHQMSWVVGGLAGLLVSMLNNGQAGLAITAGALAVALVMLVRRRRKRFGPSANDVAPQPASAR